MPQRPLRTLTGLRAALLLAGLAVLPATIPSAAALERPPPGSEIQLFVENDMWARTDRYYTHGLKFGVGLPLGFLQDLLQVPAAEVLRRIDPHGGEGIHLGLFLGQNLYTPRDITVAAPQPQDRPWAAWLYLGGVAQRARGNRLDTVEVDLGLTGPPALGEEVQKGWHRLIDARQPAGWSNQGRGEIGVLASYLQKRRYGAASGANLVVHGGATLGTVMTLARGGVLVRLGRGMSGFGPDTIEPGGAMLHGTRASGAAERRGVEWYVFAGVDHRLVARNLFLDGPFFRDGPSVERRRHVRDLSAGFSLRLDGLRFSWTRIRRSPEFDGAAVQRFDSLNLGFEF